MPDGAYSLSPEIFFKKKIDFSRRGPFRWRRVSETQSSSLEADLASVWALNKGRVKHSVGAGM